MTSNTNTRLFFGGDYLRSQKACEQCSQRKVKCDLSLPRCSTCVARNMKCNFSHRKKPGPPKGYKRRQNPQASNDTLMSDATPRTSLPTETLSPTSNQQQWAREDSQDDWLNILRSTAFNDDLIFDWPDQNFPVNDELHRDTSQYPTASASSQARDEDIDPNLPFYNIDTTVQNQLVLAYLSWSQQLFPLFPAFRKSTLDQLLTTSRDNVILDAICAVSARFSKAGNINNSNVSDSGECFIARANSNFPPIADRTAFRQVSLDNIKVSLLLAIYDAFCYPNANPVARMDETVRLAIDFGLDRLDSNSQGSRCLTDEEREEGRCLWWSIYELDGFTGWNSSRTCSVDPRSSETLLPSTPFQDLVLQDNTSESPQRFPTDLSQMWEDVIKCRTLPHGSQHLYMTSVAFSRQTFAKLCAISSNKRDIDLELLALEDCISSFRLALPEELQGNVLPSSGNASRYDQRLNAETLLILNMTTLSVRMAQCVIDPELPSSAEAGFMKQWQKCLHSAFSILDIIRDLPPKLLLTVTPTTSAIIWLAGACVELQMAVTIDASKKQYLRCRINLAYIALERLAESWDIAREFYNSLKALERAIPSIKTMSDVRHILKGWTGIPSSSGSLFAPPRSWSVEVTDNVTNNAYAIASGDAMMLISSPLYLPLGEGRV